MAKEYHTYLWQEVKGEHIYRIQSDDPVIVRNLKKQQHSKLIGHGLNQYQSTFSIECDSVRSAREMIQKFAGKNAVVEHGSEETHYVTYRHHSRNRQLELL